MKKKAKAAGIFYICLAVVSLAVGITTYSMMSKRLNKSISELNYEQPEIAAVPDANVMNSEQVEDTARKEPVAVPETPKQEQPESPAPQEPKADNEKVWYNVPLAGTVSNGFSDSSLVFSPTMMDYRAHMGVDIAAAVGTPVKAVADGVITDVYEDDLLGVTVEISHADGRVSRYCGLSATLSSDCVKDAEIKALTVIGSVGETAVSESSEASHLHFEMLKDGQQVDPASVIVFEQ